MNNTKSVFTTDSLNVNELGERLKKIMGNDLNSSSIAVVKNKEIPEDVEFPESKTKSISLKEFKNIMKVTAEEFLGRPLNSADIAVVKASDMNNNTLDKVQDDNKNSVNPQRPKLR